MSVNTDLLNCDSADSVADVLERAAEAYRESVSDLSVAWGDPNAGKIWGDIATILDRAAEYSRRAITRRGL